MPWQKQVSIENRLPFLYEKYFFWFRLMWAGRVLERFELYTHTAVTQHSIITQIKQTSLFFSQYSFTRHRAASERRIKHTHTKRSDALIRPNGIFTDCTIQRKHTTNESKESTTAIGRFCEARRKSKMTSTMKWNLIGGFLHQSVGGGVCHWWTSLSVMEGRSYRRAQLDLSVATPHVFTS